MGKEKQLSMKNNVVSASDEEIQDLNKKVKNLYDKDPDEFFVKYSESEGHILAEVCWINGGPSSSFRREKNNYGIGYVWALKGDYKDHY